LPDGCYSGLRRIALLAQHATGATILVRLAAIWWRRRRI
jgi:hypothetical protein